MKHYLSAAVLAVGLLLPQLAHASPVGLTQHAIETNDARQTVQFAFGYSVGPGYCARLRNACKYKHERGEEGEGNCRRYRQECGGRASYCERLRRACVSKEYRGEVGQGNCRRYRAECGGR